MTPALATLVLIVHVCVAAEDEPRWLSERQKVDRPFFRPDSKIPFNTVRQLVFDPSDSSKFYSAGDDKVVRKWTIGASPKGLVIRPTSIFRWPLVQGNSRGAINGLSAKTIGDRTVLAFGGDGLRNQSEIRLIDSSNGDEISRLVAPPQLKRLHTAPVFSISLHPREPWLAACVNDGKAAKIIVWGLNQNPESISEFDPGISQARWARFSPQGDRLLAADLAGTVKVWQFDPSAGTLAKSEMSTTRLSANSPTAIRDIAWSADQTWVAASETNGLVFGDSDTGEVLDNFMSTRVRNSTNRVQEYRIKKGAGDWSAPA
jgi:WD40 repeat protein